MGKLLDPNLENLQSILDSLFEIPVYQRPYKWEREQIEEMFFDIENEFQNESVFFFGTIFLSYKGNFTSSKTIYEIVDGQQRMTTLALLLLVLYSSFYRLGVESDDSYVKLIKNYLWKEKDLENVKDKRLITSGSLEKDSLEKLFNWCFENPKDFISKVRGEEKTANVFEHNFYKNVIIINEQLEKYVVNNDNGRFAGKSAIDKQKLFFSYLRESINVITITLENGNSERKKLFEIFESINSKGKQLEQIDLIKSYIFQNIPVEDYDQYLSKWGELIQKTDDKLEEYLAIFIKAKIKYYKTTIGVKYFKALSNKDLKDYYNEETLEETLKRFIDDLVKNVENFRKLTINGQYIITNDEFKFYTAAIRYLKYSHPLPLLFRAYCDFSNPEYSNMDKNRLTKLTRNIFVFMLLFQTLHERDSKETGTKFEIIMDLVYKNRQNYYTLVINKLQKELNLENLCNPKSINDLINKHVGYTKNETRVLLCAYEFNNENRFSYDKMLYILEEKNIQVDHIAVQRPEKDNQEYTYYCTRDEDENEVLFLKENSDYYEAGNVFSGMEYDLFIGTVLNRTGNLQLMWKTQNNAKSNGVLTLKEYPTFQTYNKIIERSKEIANKLVETKFLEII